MGLNGEITLKELAGISKKKSVVLYPFPGRAVEGGGPGGPWPLQNFKRSARFKRNFRHNCMPVLGLA